MYICTYVRDIIMVVDTLHMQEYRELRVTPLKPPVLELKRDRKPPPRIIPDPTSTGTTQHPPVLTFLPSELCWGVAKGLLLYALSLADQGKWDLVPVTCKLFSLLLAHSQASLPLHAVFSQEQLHHLMTLTCQSDAPHSSSTSHLEWGKRALQCAITDAFHHGETKRYPGKLAKVEESKKPIQKIQLIRERISRIRKMTAAAAAAKSDKQNDGGECSELVAAVETDMVESESNSKTDSLCQESVSTDSLIDSLCQESVSTDSLVEELTIATDEQNKSDTSDNSGEKDNESYTVSSLQLTDTEKSPEVPSNGAVSTEAPQDSTPYNPPPPDGEDTDKKPGSSEAAVVVSTETPQDSTLPPPDGEDTGKKPVSCEAPVAVSTETPQDSAPSNPPPPDGEDTDKKPGSSSKERSKKLQEISPRLLASRQVPKATTVRVEPQANKTEERQQSLLYQSFIISNTVETALLGSCQLPIELQLQTLSQNVYESILSSLTLAKPQGSKVQQACERIKLSVEDEHHKLGKTITLLLNSIEHLLEEAGEPHSNIDIVALLQFWKELTSLLPKEIITLVRMKGDEGDSFSAKEHAIPPLSSELALNLLFDSLLKTSSKSSKLWQLGISLIHASLSQLSKCPLFTQTVDLQLKLRQVLFKVFSLRFTSQEIDKEVVEAFLRRVCSIPFRNPQNDGTWHGSNFLLDTLIVLQDK